MGVAEGLIDVLPWSKYAVANGGPATSLAVAYRDLLQSTSGEQVNLVWAGGFENRVFAQDAVFSAAVPALEVALAALTEERPNYVRFFLVELIFLILNGDAVEDRSANDIRDLAMSGWWIIAREAIHGWEAHRETAMAILEALDAGRAHKISTLLPPAAQFAK